LPIVDLGQAVVVRLTHERDVPHRVVAAEAERVPVVELEPVVGAAPSSLLVHVAASASISHMDRSLDRGRDLPCPR
jgi:hypothetical protein